MKYEKKNVKKKMRNMKKNKNMKYEKKGVLRLREYEI